jgi:hypothetical protein
VFASDGQQFHQHEQSEQSSLNLTDLTKHKKWKTTTYNVGKLGLDYLGQVQQCGRVNPVNGHKLCSLLPNTIIYNMCLHAQMK